MVNVIKVYLQHPNSDKTEIRRLTVSSDITNRYDSLCIKVIELFPLLCDKTFRMSWKDSEGDLILLSSDNELAQAVANANDGLIKLYVHPSEHDETSNEAGPTGLLYKNITCNGCNAVIKGHRYKCLECKDYDLCSSCDAANKHPQHDMLKIVRPLYDARNWINELYARRMWRVLFGIKPLLVASPSVKEGESFTKTSSDELSKVNRWEEVFSEAYFKFSHPEEKNSDGIEDFLKEAEFEIKAGKCPFNPIGSYTFDYDPSEVEIPINFVTTKSASTKGMSDELKSHNSGSFSAQAQKTDIPESSAVSSSVIEITPSTAKTKIEVPPNYAKKEQPPVANEGDSLITNHGWILLNKEDVSRNTPVYETTLHFAGKPQQGEEKTLEDKVEQIQEHKSEKFIRNPKVSSSLLKMKSMGFSNEGNWLKRLLYAKGGSIEEALEALDPKNMNH